MKVFVSPKYPFQGSGSSLPGTVVGELVTLWTCGICSLEDCPHVGFLGLESHGVSSYAKVVERPDVDEATLALMLRADPTSRDPLTSKRERGAGDYLDFVARETLEMASNYETEQMVQRCIGGVVGVTIRPRKGAV